MGSRPLGERLWRASREPSNVFACSLCFGPLLDRVRYCWPQQGRAKEALVSTIGQVIRCALEYQLADGGAAFNVFHFETVAGTADQTDVDDAAEAVSKFWLGSGSQNGVRLYSANETIAVAAHARTVDPSNPLISDLSINDAGNGSGEAVPLESSLVTTFYTALPTRSGRGRIFRPGAYAPNLTNGRMNPTATAAEQTAINDWITTTIPGIGSIVLSVWSPTLSQGHEVLSAVTRSTMHHQRRRNS